MARIINGQYSTEGPSIFLIQGLSDWLSRLKIFHFYDYTNDNFYIKVNKVYQINIYELEIISKQVRKKYEVLVKIEELEKND